MKKAIRICIMVGLMALTMALTACSIIGDCFSCVFGCGGSSSSSSSSSSNKTNTVSFWHNGEEYTTEVYRDEYYRIERLPRKEGYIFGGLYDSETGGEMVVDKDGYSLEEFSGKKDITLYPRFYIAEYTVYFNIENAYGIYETSNLSPIKVVYGEEFTPPLNLLCINCEFDGWYTASSGGRRITYADAVVEGANVLTSNNFALPNSEPYKITLYAHFNDLAEVN